MIYSTIVVAVNKISQQQTKGTELTKIGASILLYYMYTHSNAKLVHHHSDMILKVHNDESYLSFPGGISSAGEHFYFGDSILLTEEDKEQGALYV